MQGFWREWHQSCIVPVRLAKHAAGLGSEVINMPASGEMEIVSNTDVDVWEIGLGIDADAFRDCDSILTPADRQRAARYRFERDRRRFMTARAGLRSILARYTNRAPQELVFVTSAYGKPRLFGTQLEFNLSHSQNVALCAVARNPVGIDIEYVRPVNDLLQIVGACFSDEEAAVIRQLPEPEQLAAFYRCWTRKEAYLKALGHGLSIALSSFTVSIEQDNPRLLFSEHGYADQWHMQNIPAPRGYVASVVISTRSMRHRPICRMHRWNPELVSESLGEFTSGLAMAAS
jgi:4'-phosphopantetheinyl transferase